MDNISDVLFELGLAFRRAPQNEEEERLDREFKELQRDLFEKVRTGELPVPDYFCITTIRRNLLNEEGWFSQRGRSESYGRFETRDLIDATSDAVKIHQIVKTYSIIALAYYY